MEATKMITCWRCAGLKTNWRGGACGECSGTGEVELPPVLVETTQECFSCQGTGVKRNPKWAEFDAEANAALEAAKAAGDHELLNTPLPDGNAFAKLHGPEEWECPLCKGTGRLEVSPISVGVDDEQLRICARQIFRAFERDGREVTEAECQRLMFLWISEVVSDLLDPRDVVDYTDQMDGSYRFEKARERLREERRRAASRA